MLNLKEFQSAIQLQETEKYRIKRKKREFTIYKMKHLKSKLTFSCKMTTFPSCLFSCHSLNNQIIINKLEVCYALL